MQLSILTLLTWTSGFILSVLLVLLLTITIYIFYLHRKFAHIPGPPVDNFYLGHIPTLKKLAENEVYSSHLFKEWTDTYGDLYQIRILHMVMLIPSSPKILKEVLSKGKYPKHKETYQGLFGAFGSRYMGYGLITNTNHAQWYKRRSTVNPAFHKRALSNMITKFNNVATTWLKKLSEHADGKNISMLDYANRVTMAAIVQVGFGLDLDVIHDKDNDFPRAVSMVLQAVNTVSQDPLSNFYPSLSSYRKDCRKAAATVRQYGKKCLQDRINKINSEEDVPNDILTFILKMKETVPSLTMDDITDEFDTLFLAGQETTANTLCFMFNIIGERPDVKAKIIEEIERVLGDRTEVTWDDVNQLEYITMVMKETLRLFPVAPGTVRGVTEEAHIDGFRIPAGSRLFANFFIMHRSGKYYDNPLEFIPERWSPNAERPQLFTYMPFSTGPRTCAGQHFAQIEIKIFIARFFQRFSYILDPNQDFGIKDNITLYPKGGSVMTLIDKLK